MINFTAKPERTYALVVGIEKYQEKVWNVKAPAMDALKFAHWLIQKGVPKANIRLCLSYLEENQDLFSQAEIEIEAATEANIFAIITDFLSQKPGDLLYIFWAGHGLITSERERRLLCADITQRNWQNIDLNSLLLFLNSDAFAIRNHICIIDACANYLVESAGRPTNLGGRSFSSGKPRTESQQFVLLATREGEKAKVNSPEKTGYFSQAVREALEAEPLDIWPPDMLKVADRVKQQFASLDKQQLPTYYFYQTWDGDKYSENPFTKSITPQNLPRSSVIKFVGRETALTELHQKLHQRERVAITAIAGMGGVGKTELALQYALHYWEQGTYPGGVCWLRVRNEDIGTQILQFAINQLGLKPPEDFDLKAQIDYCWRVWQDGDVLIILDDVIKYEQIQDYLPPSLPKFKFRVLVTTRIQQLQESFQNLDLGVLDETAALELLISFIGEERIYREIDAAKQLCADLGYLPLGLELVARYLQQKQDLSLVEMQKRLVLKHRSLQKPSAEMTAKLGVQAAFELSWQELDNEAQKLACLLSIFALAPIPWHLVERCLPDADAEDVEDLRDDFLVKLSLIQRTGQGIYQLHLLIREFLGDKREKLADAAELKRSFCQVMVEEAQEIPQTPNQEEIAAFTLTIPHLGEAATVQKYWLSDEDLIRPFLGLIRFYEGQGLYQQALPWSEQCLSITRERLGESHPDVALSLNNLAALYDSQGRYTEAEPLYLQALELYKRLLGESHPDVAISLNNLAGLYYSQGRYTEAEPLYLQALELCKRLLGESHPDVATSLNNLALLYKSQGRYTAAEPLYLQALELRKQLLGESHPSVATSLNNLAELYRFQGRYTEAEPLFLQALELRKQLLGESHLDVATSLNNLALLYKSQGRYTEAEPLFLQALELRKQLLGESHPDVAQSLNNLAGLYKSQGRYTEAEPLFLQALDLWKQLLGESHPHVALSLNNLAELYHSQGRYTKAEPLFLQALELRKQLLGESHPSVATSLNNLAFLYSSQGRYTEAEPLFLQALELRKQLLGESHPSVATSLNNLAELYRSQGRYTEAEPLYVQALELRKQLLGESHPSVATSLNNLAELYRSQGRYTEAEPLFLQALELRKQLLGESHPHVTSSLNNLARLYDSQGKYTEAEPLYLQALDILEQQLGVNHPHTITVRNNLQYLRDNYKP